MVPKRMDARWAALLPPGLSSSESSSDSSSLSEPHPSSERRRLDTGIDGPAGAAVCVMRWKGLVETSAWGGGGGATGGAGAGGAGGAATLDNVSEDCDIILKYGLRLSGGLEVTICGRGGGVACRSGSGSGAGSGSRSRLTIWLPPKVGVDAWGVICSGPSSSDDELSSSIASSCLRRSSSRFRAASISARRWASWASFSFASASAAFFFCFSSAFLSLPCRTCSSRAFKRASASWRSLARSSSWALALSLRSQR